MVTKIGYLKRMGEFIITLISVALLSAVMGMLSPEGETKKYVRFVGSLCLLCALAAPVAGLISEGSDPDWLVLPEVGKNESYDDIYMKALVDGSRENAEVAIKGKLCENFELSEKSLDVALSVEYDGEKYTVGEAVVTLNSSAVFVDPRDISAYVNSELGCACTVIYG